MSAEWFYSEGDRRLGPVPEDELARLAANGTVKRTDLVWTEGMSDWVEARTVASLFPKRPDPEPLDDDRPPARRRGFDAEAGFDQDGDRPRRSRRVEDERVEDEELDDDRPRVRRDYARDDYDDRPRRRSNVKPGNLQAVAIMLLIGGILGVLYGLASAVGSAGFCCLWPGTYFELVWGILAIIRGANMLGKDDEGPPRTLAICQIICIVNLDVLNCIMGIVNLVMLNDDSVGQYYRRRGH